MKFFSITLLLIAGLIICNCQTTNKKQQAIYNENFKTINIINANKYDNAKITSYIDSIFTIKLETNNNCLIGKIRKILFSENLIFIFDKLNQSIFIFDQKGIYKSKIANKGKGKGEYLSITDFDIDTTNKVIVIFDEFKRKMLYYNYDGSFSHSNKFKTHCDNFALLSNSSVAIFNSMNSIVKYKAKVLITNKQGHLSKAFIPFNENLIDDMYKLWDYLPLSNSGRRAIDHHSNTIYKIDSTGILYGLYRFNFKNYNLPNGKLWYNRKTREKTTNYARISKYIESSSQIQMTYVLNNQWHFFYFDKITNNSFKLNYPNKELVEQNISLERLLRKSKITVHNDFFVSYIEPHTLINYKNKKGIFSDFLSTHDLNKTKPTDNPILLFTKLKSL